LYRAGIHPERRACDVSADEAERLVVAIRDVLNEAIASGGSSLRDYKKADGGLGYFQHHFAVYGQEGEACKDPGCGQVVDRIVQAGRSTFYCTGCQV
jgi:formamidopyrimidine-DNA glycosylase